MTTPTSLKRLKRGDLIGQGSFNSVYKTSNPNIVLRESNTLIAPSQVDDYKTETEFNTLAQKKYPGEVVDHVFFDNSATLKADEMAISYREAFDSDLNKYLIQQFYDAFLFSAADGIKEARGAGQLAPNRKKHLKNVTIALDDAVQAFDKLVQIGIFCSDVKPGNFLVKKNRPVGYKGKKKSIYVRMIDLDGSFCTLDPFMTDEELNLYRDLTLIQLYVMAFEIYKAVRPFAYSPGKTYYTTNLTYEGKMAIIRSVRKKRWQRTTSGSELHDICDNVDEIQKKVNEWLYPNDRWNTVIETFKHYVGSFDYENILCSDVTSLAGPRPPSGPNRVAGRSQASSAKKQSASKKSPVRLPSASKKGTATAKRAEGKQCKGKAPIGKICNPKTGRWVLRNGKIGRMIVARASYKSPNRRTASRAEGSRSRMNRRKSPRKRKAKKKRKSPRKRKAKKKRKSPRKKKKNTCASNKIRNPKTGRCVLRRGKIGQQILRGKV